MANTAGVTIEFAKFLLASLNANAFKAALYLASASRANTDTAYTGTGEVSGTNYTAGGVALGGTPDWVTVGNTGGTIFSTPTQDITFTNVSLAVSFDCVMIYDTSRANAAVANYTFAAQTVLADDFILIMPTNNASDALLKITV